MSLVKLPGMVDVHTHLREPGAVVKEDFLTGTAAALAGGVTLVLDMPNNPIPTLSTSALWQKEKIASQKAVCDYGLIFGASLTDNTAEFAKIKHQVAALKIYLNQTTGNLLINNFSLLAKIFASWSFDKPIMVHAEGESLVKAIALAKRYHKHLHCCHVSLKEEVELLKKAKEKGIRVTAEATPHHLFLTKQDGKKLGPFGLMKPPLASQRDVNALWQALKKGIIDLVATDHAPHTKKEKESGKPPFGVPGLETALPLLLTAYKEGRLTLEEVIRLYSENPRRIFKLPNQPQTFIEVDLSKKFTIKNENLKTKCGWSPFAGWLVYGQVEKVVLRGKTVYNQGKVLVKPGFGQNIYGQKN